VIPCVTWQEEFVITNKNTNAQELLSISFAFVTGIYETVQRLSQQQGIVWAEPELRGCSATPGFVYRYKPSHNTPKSLMMDAVRTLKCVNDWKSL
jgi:hypothetical protein